jgi:hypothetical protein
MLSLAWGFCGLSEHVLVRVEALDRAKASVHAYVSKCRLDATREHGAGAEPRVRGTTRVIKHACPYHTTYV